MTDTVPDGDIAKKIQEKRGRVQKAKALHDQKTKERADTVSNIKAAYLQQKDSLILVDILAKSKMFLGYHQKIAQDGMGARKTGFQLQNGTDEIENYFLGSEERVGHLDKAAGLQEIIDYIERQLKEAAPVPDAAKVAEVATVEDVV